MSRKALMLATFAVAGSLATQGNADARCALVGQVATSSFLQFTQALTSGNGAEVDAASARLADLTTAYAGLGCAPDRLGRAIDCVLAGAGMGNTRDLARGCLAAEGLAETDQ